MTTCMLLYAYSDNRMGHTLRKTRNDIASSRGGLLRVVKTRRPKYMRKRTPENETEKLKTNWKEMELKA